MKVLAAKELNHLEAVAIEQTRAHISKLHAKSKQLVHFDDYGNLIDELWERELAYFVETVVLPKQSHRWVKITEEMKESLIATVQSEVFAYDLASEPAGNTYQVDMHGVEFEALVRSLIERRGFAVQLTKATGDQGVDLIVNTAQGLIAIQCKRSRTTVGNKAVQEAFSGASFRSITRIWVVSDAPYSTSARQLAGSLGVKLVDFRNMDEHLAPYTPGTL